MCDRYAPYPYANVFPVTPPHAAAWWDGKNKGYQKGHHDGYNKGYNTAYDEGKGVGFLKGKEGKDTAYEEGKGVGYLKGKESLAAASSEQAPRRTQKKRRCPACNYAFVGLRQHAWAVHDLDLNEEDYPLADE